MRKKLRRISGIYDQIFQRKKNIDPNRSTLFLACQILKNYILHQQQQQKSILGNFIQKKR